MTFDEAWEEMVREAERDLASHDNLADLAPLTMLVLSSVRASESRTKAEAERH